MLLGDPRPSEQRTQSFHFPIVVHQSLDPAAQSSAQAPSSLSFIYMHFEVRALDKLRTRVDALGQRAVEVIICMITRDFSVMSMTSRASLSLSLSLSLPLTKLTDAQYRKRFRASYNYSERRNICNTSMKVLKIDSQSCWWLSIGDLDFLSTVVEHTDCLFLIKTACSSLHVGEPCRIWAPLLSIDRQCVNHSNQIVSLQLYQLLNLPNLSLSLSLFQAYIDSNDTLAEDIESLCNAGHILAWPALVRDSVWHSMHGTVRVLHQNTVYTQIGPVCIRHSYHHFATQSSHLVDRAGWQAKMASIEFWIPWRNAHGPHWSFRDVWMCPAIRDILM